MTTAAWRNGATRRSAVTGRLGRLWRELRFRDALLITLVPLLLIGYLVGSSLAAYRRAQSFDDFAARSFHVTNLFRDRLRALWNMPGIVALRPGFDPRAADPGIIRIGIDGERWDSLVSNDVPDWARWYNATLEYGGTNIPVRVRKRGDTSIHWLTQKRSLSVRTPRDQFYKSYRGFGLSSKEVLSGFVANRLARNFQVMGSHTEVVPVFVNDRFYGMFRFIEPVDESFLRPFDRMPGNIFRGDRAERGEARPGQPRNLFENVYLWDRAAMNDRWTSAGPGQIRLLIEGLNSHRFEDARRMMARHDAAELSRLVAYLLVAGDPYHMDNLHNQLLYEDPSTHLLHPIPWDTRLLRLGETNQPVNQLMKAWLRDPFVVDGANRELAKAIAADGVRGTIDSLLEETERRYGHFFEYDRRRGRVVGTVGSPAEVRSTFRHNFGVIANWLINDTVAVGVTARGADAVLDFETRGRVGVDFVAFTSAGTGTPRLWMDTDLDGVRGAGDTELSLRADPAVRGRFVLVTPRPLLAGWNMTRGIQPGHIPYRFFLTGAGSVTPELRNRVSGVAAARVDWAAGETMRAATAWHPWLYPTRTPRAHRFSGTVRLTKTLRIPEGDTLILAPGTTLRLAPEVSIVSKGRVIAIGAPRERIRIISDVAGRPWGTFSLLGHGSDSSVIRHAEIAWGGGAVVDRIEYIGMVNVHRAVGVVFDDVFFHDNLRSDDTFHALHATVVLTNSRFLNANGDAIDFDIAGGEISRTLIENSVNDGVDLMTSNPWVYDNVIVGSQDKGISIGEASPGPVIFNNRIVRCLRGIEVKDRSQPIILNNEVDSSGVSMRERRKNWRYGGGPFSTIALTIFRASGDVSHDPFSRMTLWGTVGIDSVEEAAAPQTPSLDWLYARLGIRPSVPRPGRLAYWERTQPVPPVDQASFVDDFVSVSDGWVGTGGAQRVEKRSNALVMEVERIAGTAARAVRWSLPAGGTLIIEVAGEDLAGGRLIAVPEQGDPVERTFAVSPEPYAYRMVELQLPAGSYRELRVEATPRPGLSHSIQRATGLSVLRAGLLYLRNYAVYPPAPAPR